MIWRRLQIPGHTSLTDLHHIIQIVNGWDDDHLHLFHIYGKDYGIPYVGGMAFSDDPNFVHIDDFEFDIGDRLVYEYNFFEHWLHDIRIEAIETGELHDKQGTCTRTTIQLRARPYSITSRQGSRAITEAIAHSDGGDWSGMDDQGSDLRTRCRSLLKCRATIYQGNTRSGTLARDEACCNFRSKATRRREMPS